MPRKQWAYRDTEFLKRLGFKSWRDLVDLFLLDAALKPPRPRELTVQHVLEFCNSTRAQIVNNKLASEQVGSSEWTKVAATLLSNFSGRDIERRTVGHADDSLYHQVMKLPSKSAVKAFMELPWPVIVMNMTMNMLHSLMNVTQLLYCSLSQCRRSQRAPANKRPKIVG